MDGWELSNVGGCLMMLARDSIGADNEELLAQQAALLAHPAMRERRRTSDDDCVCLTEVLNDLRGDEPRSKDIQAAMVLLGLVSIPGTPDRTGRLKHAAKLLGCQPDAFKKAERRGKRHSGLLYSKESELFERIVAWMNIAQLRVSSTRGTPRTPRPGTLEQSDPVLLRGTWRGKTEAYEVFNDEEAAADGEAPTYMVIEPRLSELDVRWYYRGGQSVAVSTRFVAVDDGHQLVCVFEADQRGTVGREQPGHRGSCILTLHEGRVRGPFFTDRRSYGWLDFDTRTERLAGSFAEAVRLFRR